MLLFFEVQNNTSTHTTWIIGTFPCISIICRYLCYFPSQSDTHI